MPREAYVGIDVAFAKGKRLPVVFCTRDDERLIPFELRGLDALPPRGEGNRAALDAARRRAFAEATRTYLLEVADLLGVEICRIAIDAPSGPCTCETGRRAAERALDQASISCIATPTASQFERALERAREHLARGGALNRLPHANQLWMLVGFDLYDALAQVAPCLEVFPQATVRVLGCGAAHKSHSDGLAAQLAAAARCTGWPMGAPGEPKFERICYGPGHDWLDAYLSAWVASLEEDDRHAFGTPSDDVIWTPRHDVAVRWPETAPLRGGLSASPEPREDRPAQPAPVDSPRVSSRSVGGADGHFRKLCPACRTKVFKRWPWGWDAHAEHTCTGLSADGREARKAEFKERFADHFS